MVWGRKMTEECMLREFANNSKMVICNTVFKPPKRRIWTWQGPRSIIKCRIGMAKSKFYDNLKIFTVQLSTTTKKQMMKSLVWSVALYAAEAWTMRKVDTQRLEAFEMWCWRKMLKISYKEHVTNDEVLSRAK